MVHLTNTEIPYSLVVNRQFNEREVDFINCVIWRQQAENLANWAKKGALIGINGRIQTRNFENQQGQRVYVTEVAADSFQLLESHQERGNAPTPPFADAHEPFSNLEPMNIREETYKNLDKLEKESNH